MVQLQYPAALRTHVTHAKLIDTPRSLSRHRASCVTHYPNPSATVRSRIYCTSSNCQLANEYFLKPRNSKTGFNIENLGPGTECIVRRLIFFAGADRSISELSLLSADLRSVRRRITTVVEHFVSRLAAARTYQQEEVAREAWSYQSRYQFKPLN